MSERRESSDIKAKIKDSSDDKVLVIMLILCFVLVIALVSVNIINAPRFEEPVFTPETSENGISSHENSYGSSDSEEILPIKINTATSDELQKIPGIGPVTAQKIIDFREEQGTIVEFSDLLAIDGIGEKTVKTIAEYCIIN